jgi:hypothetical protein
VCARCVVSAPGTTTLGIKECLLALAPSS